MGSRQEVHFGTDGWRAIIDQDFNRHNIAATAKAAAKAFLKEHPAGGRVIVGFDCRRDAAIHAQLAAQVMAGQGLEVLISRDYCPTPVLCWSVKQDDAAIGGLMITASHNAGEYSGIKLRMNDGGASPKAFTDLVEGFLDDEPAPLSQNITSVDLVTPYLDELLTHADKPRIAAAGLKVLVDPLYGANRVYMKRGLEAAGVQVTQIHGEADPDFGGLHPEPIEPWTNEACAAVRELGLDAGFISDGDGDRLCAIDSQGRLVNPHRILMLIIQYLAGKGAKGRVVSTFSASTMVRLQCKRFGLPYTETPVGFKWIYQEMLKGDVIVGGEESGGIGIPQHVCERDGLLMALLLCELMATTGMNLDQLLAQTYEAIGGEYHYKRRDLRVTQPIKERFLAALPTCAPTELAGQPVLALSRADGIRFDFPAGAWLLMRTSGTEPLVRIYAESLDPAVMEALLDAGQELVEGA